MTNMKLFGLLLIFIPFIYAGETGLPYGHPNRCRDFLNVKYADLPTLGELPGEGFDNLVNLPMAAVVDTKYTMCKTTDDGHFLIPDSVTVVPIKESHLQTTSSFFQHWDNFTSTTSRSINIEAGFGSFFTQISGKFSKEYQMIKTRQYLFKTSTLRVQLRHSRYRAHLVHGASLHPSFKRDLEEITDHILSNRQELAKYDRQLLVRQYGTHVVTGIELGASFVKIDQLTEEFDIKTEGEKHNIQLAAEISFFHWLEGNHNRTRNYTLGYGFSDATLTESLRQYNMLRHSTEMFSLGGSIITLNDNIDHSWGSSVEGNLVSLDRMGDPIYYFINEETLPNIPSSVLSKLTKVVSDAVDSYYQQNVIRGCTDPRSPSFSFEANVDDGTCTAEDSMSSYAFGGIYQECAGDAYVCGVNTSPNPLTGTYSCPNGFLPRIINYGKKSMTLTTYESTSCGLFYLYTCYNTKNNVVYGLYNTFWCYASPGANRLLFGGLFTPYRVNVRTQEQYCPPEFSVVTILDDLHVCLSQDMELGRRNALPFGGFYSCTSGNPFANNIHGCPKGYSPHMAYDDDGCEINYCIKSGAIDSKQLPRIQKPPYMDKPMYNEIYRIGVAKNGTIVELDNIPPGSLPILKNNGKTKISRASAVRAALYGIIGVLLINNLFISDR